jgi:hypothetical protein
MSLMLVHHITPLLVLAGHDRLLAHLLDIDFSGSNVFAGVSTSFNMLAGIRM